MSYCSECGTAVGEEPFCPHCGQKVHEAPAAESPTQATPIVPAPVVPPTADPPPPESVPPPPAPPPGGSNKRPYIIGAIIAAVILLTGIAGFALARSAGGDNPVISVSSGPVVTPTPTPTPVVTVTQTATPTPTPTVTVTKSSSGPTPADATDCGSGVTAVGPTSCPFALAVRNAFNASGGSSYLPKVLSPVTGERYDMSCDTSVYPVRCTGGNGAIVLIR